MDNITSQRIVCLQRDRRGVHCIATKLNVYERDKASTRHDWLKRRSRIDATRRPTERKSVSTRNRVHGTQRAGVSHTYFGVLRLRGCTASCPTDIARSWWPVSWKPTLVPRRCYRIYSCRWTSPLTGSRRSRSFAALRPPGPRRTTPRQRHRRLRKRFVNPWRTIVYDWRCDGSGGRVL